MIIQHVKENRYFSYTRILAVIIILVLITIGFITIGSHSLPDFSPKASATSIDITPQLSFKHVGTDVVIDIRYYYCNGVNTKIPNGCGNVVYGQAIELEIDGKLEIIQNCYVECSDVIDPEGQGYLLLLTNCSERGHGLMTTSYNMGEITGTPPKVRARVRRVGCDNEGQYTQYSIWSNLVDAVVPEPIPLVEIATVIGIGGIAIAVINNYWSGRREKQMTEVTRTAAVDERFMELYDASRETTFQENMAEVLYQYEWMNYDNFLEKYGPRTNVAAWAKIQSLAQYFEGIGVMLQSNSVEIDQVYRLLSTQIIRCWEKLQSVILEQRQRELDPRIYSSFETLYYAIKKYEQEPTKTVDDVKTHRFED